MSKTPRTPRAKSGSMRALGAMRLVHDVPTKVSPSTNDPALHINQLQPPVHALFDKQKDAQREREYREKERKLSDQISGLEKLIAQLRNQLKIKSEKCIDLEKTISLKANEYEEMLAQCKAEHDKTKSELEESKMALEENKTYTQTTIDKYEMKIKDIIEEYEGKLSALQKSKDKELKDKEDKLDLLKRRMATSLGKNSQERQHQLEELKRDLINQAQEARELQQKLKNIQISKNHQCGNCRKLEEKLEDRNLQLRMKERTIDELQGIGRKMKVQLTQQERKSQYEGKVRQLPRDGVDALVPPEPPTTALSTKLEGTKTTIAK